MKRRYIFLTAVLISAAMISGCGEKDSGDSSSAPAETSSAQSEVMTETSASEESVSVPETTEEDTPAPEITESVTDLFLSADNKSILIGTDSNEIIFVARDIMIDTEVELIDADTGEVVGIMLDDADFEHSGDDIKGDAWYSLRYKVDIDFPTDPDVSEERRYHYYARYIDGTTEHRSDELEIFVCEPFTEKELDNMDIVENAVEELLASDDFKDLELDDKIEAMMELLHDLEKQGLVDEGSVNATGDVVSYTSGGMPTGVKLRPFDPMLN